MAGPCVPRTWGTSRRGASAWWTYVEASLLYVGTLGSLSHLPVTFAITRSVYLTLGSLGRKAVSKNSKISAVMRFELYNRRESGSLQVLKSDRVQDRSNIQNEKCQ